MIFLEDVEVPKENMLPKVKGLKVRGIDSFAISTAFFFLQIQRLYCGRAPSRASTALASGFLGVPWAQHVRAGSSSQQVSTFFSGRLTKSFRVATDSCMDIARQYTLDRAQFGAPLAAYVFWLWLSLPFNAAVPTPFSILCTATSSSRRSWRT
jgi:hypothetical protein